MKRIIVNVKNMALGCCILFSLSACETGYKGETPPATNVDNNSSSEYKFEYEEEPFKPQVFEGGYLSDGLDIAKIRQSKGDNRLRLVFDTYKVGTEAGKLGVPTDKVGSYSFVYYPEKYLITAIVGGYRAFSASLPKFSNSSVVDKIYMDEYLDDSGYKFHIKLKEDAKVKVFDLQNPARIVVDISW